MADKGTTTEYEVTITFDAYQSSVEKYETLPEAEKRYLELKEKQNAEPNNLEGPIVLEEVVRREIRRVNKKT